MRPIGCDRSQGNLIIIILWVIPVSNSTSTSNWIMHLCPVAPLNLALPTNVMDNLHLTRNSSRLAREKTCKSKFRLTSWKPSTAKPPTTQRGLSLVWDTAVIKSLVIKVTSSPPKFLRPFRLRTLPLNKNTERVSLRLFRPPRPIGLPSWLRRGRDYSKGRQSDDGEGDAAVAVVAFSHFCRYVQTNLGAKPSDFRE